MFGYFFKEDAVYKKKIIALFLLCGLASYYGVQRAASEPVRQYRRPHFNSAHKPVILWDIHDVILERDTEKLKRDLSGFEGKADVFRQSSVGMVKDMFYGVYKMFKSGSTAEYFLAVARKHNNRALEKLIITIANAQRVIPGTADIIEDLHAQGYRQCIGSNMGVEMFENLMEQPYAHAIFNREIFHIDASELVVYDKEDPARAVTKPQQAFYGEFLRKNNLDSGNVVFIDDKAKNVRAAQECGMYGIQYQKSSEKLHDDLWFLLGLTGE